MSQGGGRSACAGLPLLTRPGRSAPGVPDLLGSPHAAGIAPRHQALRLAGGQRRHLPDGRTGRDPRPARRERRRQVHADERPLRPLPARRGRDPGRRRAVQHFPARATPSRAGIGMVHQHFMLVPVFTVAENVMLGRRADRFRPGARPRRRARSGCAEISDRFGFHVDPDALVEDLPVGVQQRVEIIKALSARRRVLVFDEPTAVLTPQETDELLAIMRQLERVGHGASSSSPTSCARSARSPTGSRSSGRGKVVGEASPTASQRRARGADGRPRRSSYGRTRTPPEPGERRLVVDGPRRVDRRDRLVHVDDVSFDVRGGRDRSASPASRATARPSSSRPCSACSRTVRGLDHARRRGAGRPHVAPGPRRRRRLHPRGPPGRRAGRRASPIAENLMLDRSFGRAVRPARDS